MSTMSTEPLIPTDEHDELITALIAGRWWAIMEVEDLLRSSSEKGESEHLPSGQSWGIVEESPVPTAFPEEAPAPARPPKGPAPPARAPKGPVPSASLEGKLVPPVSPEEACALARSPEGASVSTASSKEAPSQARASLRKKITIPENIRLYLKRDVILTPLPLRPLKGPAPPARAPKEGPVPSTSPEEAPIPTVSPEEARAPAKSPEEEIVPPASPKEAPALARSPEKALEPIRFLKRSPGLATPLRGVPWKRLCPWRTGALDNVCLRQRRPHRKRSMPKKWKKKQNFTDGISTS
ncbi:hypothetical protein Q8A67_022390 [Cirrhinus molitorella]|uniref:Uncharacterized protein n=1 Tax=Cirrhinus molitorella TaxID=172907 RepID=A0AA88TDF3_9TELE|nr:hypothetical protein Q8A67_022390 [Cirrhinus molitorella]